MASVACLFSPHSFEEIGRCKGASLLVNTKDETMNSNLKQLSHAKIPLLFTLISTLAACGGGGDSAAVMRSVPIVVIDGAIEKASVCFDRNENGTCDTGEPRESPTRTAK